MSIKQVIFPFIIYDPSKNTFLNSLGDQICHTIGYFIYLNIRKKYEFTKIHCILILLISNILGWSSISFIFYNKHISKKN
jgi:hypothetical protein